MICGASRITTRMLGHLGTRPSTTYLARLSNPNPALREKGSKET